MDMVKGTARLLGQLVVALMLTLVGSLVAYLLVISLGGEPVLQTATGGSVFGLAMIVAGVFVFRGLRNME